MAAESISSERKQTYFQRYIFDAYKYQDYFNASTQDILEKVQDGLWPFHPDTQPEALVLEYNGLCKQLFPTQKYNELKKEGAEATVNGVHNPFAMKENKDLTFIGRDLEQNPLGTPKPTKYKREMAELYGPMWIFITLIVEFVILGHMTNSI